MQADDSLLLAYDRRRGKPKGVDRAAASASTCHQIYEDPQKWYLRKVKGIYEPQSVPLLFGSAVHEAMEVFYQDGSPAAAVAEAEQSIASGYGEVENPVVRYNPDDPSLPTDKKEIKVSASDLQNRARELLTPILEALSIEDWKPYSPLSIDPVGTEIPLGTLAAERGLPNGSIYGYNGERMTDIPVAVIAGVPVRGSVDLVGTWPGGGEVILDHKCVSRVVSYYPNWRGSGRKAYAPSYDPASSSQLDIYAYGSGIDRAGFQFITKYPQYYAGQTVWDGWVDEAFWEGEGLPMAWLETDGLRYICVWRPQPADGAKGFTRSDIGPRTERYVRRAAEFITEGLLLLEEGEDPAIAFPAGDPDEIAKKACPYCFYNDEGHCPAPRSDTKASKKAYQETMAQREQACKRSKKVQERRSHWREGRPEHWGDPAGR